MGIKTVIIGLTFSADHHATAAKAGHQLEGTRRSAILKATETIVDLRRLVGQMPVSDPQIAIINAAIAALS